MTNDKRDFPRIDEVSSRQIILLNATQTPQKSFVLTANLSGSGIQFTTNSPLTEGHLFLIYLNDVLINDLKINRVNLVRSGDHYLCRVVWNQKQDNKTQVGACFLERKLCNSDELETFVELVNLSTLDSLPDLNLNS